MNIESLLSGAFSAGVVTMAWNLYNRQNEFEYDHKKYILKKRQMAYESIEELLLRLQVRNIDAFDNKAFHNIYYDPKRPTDNVLAEFNSDLNDLMGYSVWMTDEILKHIGQLNAIINYSLRDLTETFDLHESANIGKELQGKIEKIRVILFRQYLTDMKDLKKINSFLKKKSLM